MTRQTIALSAVLSLLPIGQPLLFGSTTALATGAMLLSTNAAHAQSAQVFFKRGLAKYELVGDLKGACADWRKASSLGVQEAAGWVKDQCQ